MKLFKTLVSWMNPRKVWFGYEELFLAVARKLNEFIIYTFKHPAFKK